MTTDHTKSMTLQVRRPTRSGKPLPSLLKPGKPLEDKLSAGSLPELIRDVHRWTRLNAKCCGEPFFTLTLGKNTSSSTSFEALVRKASKWSSHTTIFKLTIRCGRHN